MLGSYYCYDIPGTLIKQMHQQYNTTVFQQNMYYSVYSFPNTVLPLFGGFFVDRWGTNLSLFVFTFLITAGQAVFALGASLGTYWIMVAGRILFGFGGESLGVAQARFLQSSLHSLTCYCGHSHRVSVVTACVAQTTLVALWFENKELAFALGINLSISRLGTLSARRTSCAGFGF
jgi:MFS family permease